MKKIVSHTIGPTFSERVVKLALSIPSGKVTTYGDLTRAAGGGAMAAQSVTTILAKAWNQGEKRIPFHRIVYSEGRIWKNPEYDAERMKKYKKESIKVDEKGRIENFQKVLFRFK